MQTYNVMVRTVDGRMFAATFDRDRGIAWRDGNAWLASDGDASYAADNSRSWEYAAAITPLEGYLS